jgi:hypothetical protein
MSVIPPIFYPSQIEFLREDFKVNRKFMRLLYITLRGLKSLLSCLIPYMRNQPIRLLNSENQVWFLSLQSIYPDEANTYLNSIIA